MSPIIILEPCPCTIPYCSCHESFASFLCRFNETLEQGLNLDSLNSSYIVLIPKKEEARKPQDFRPISLLHGIQKMISKILANRLQPHIQHLVKDSQTGFVKGRQITCYEIVKMISLNLYYFTEILTLIDL